MTDLWKALGKKKWFVPTVLVLLLLLALPSFFHKGEEKTDLQNRTTEERIEELCNAMYGVRNAKVVIAYENVTTASAFASSTESTPRVVGIAVVCDGGADPEVQLRIYAALSALYRLSSRQISVSGRGI